MVDLFNRDQSGIINLVYNNKLKCDYNHNTIIYDIETYALNGLMPDVHNDSSNISVI